MNCNQCKKELPSDGDHVTCSKCNNSYHFECSGLKKTTWRAKSSKLKNEWECLTCRGGKSRHQSIGSDPDLDDSTTQSLKTFIQDLFKKQEKTLTERMDNMITMINHLEERFLTTLNKVKEIEETTLSLKKDITELKLSLEQEKQYGRSKNFIITSIPQKEKEDVRETVVKLLNSMDIGIRKEEITAHRLPSKKSPAPIIVQCMARETRDAIVRRARKMKPKVSLFIQDSQPDRAIFFNDHLTPYFSDLMAKANQTRKNKGYKFIWMNGNKIMLKKDNLSRAIQIVTQEDLKKIN